LDEVRFVIPSNRALVVTAFGTLAGGDVRRLGLTVIERPATIGEIVAAAATLMSTNAPGHNGQITSPMHRG